MLPGLHASLHASTAPKTPYPVGADLDQHLDPKTPYPVGADLDQHLDPKPPLCPVGPDAETEVRAPVVSQAFRADAIPPSFEAPPATERFKQQV